MKAIRAIFRPFLRSNVITALQKMKEFPGANIFEIMGIRHGDEHHDKKSRDSLLTESPHFVELEIIAPDSLVDEIVETIRKNASTGKNGDGKIVISPVEEIIRIWDGGRGEDVL